MQFESLKHRLASWQIVRIAFVEHWRVSLTITLFCVILLFAFISFPRDMVRQISCAKEESILVYPHYDRRGTIAEYQFVCGIPHRGCQERKKDAKTFDCSPFMKTKDLWANGEIMID